MPPRVQHVDDARVVVVQPVKLALPEQVELYALHDVPAGDSHGPGNVQIVAFEHLQLQRYPEIVLRQPATEANDAVSALRGRPDDQRLHPIEIQLPARIAILGKVRPLAVDDGVEFRRSGLRLRNDSGAHRIAHQFGDSLAGVRVVAQQITRPVAQVDQRRSDFGVRVAACGDPTFRAAPRLRALIPERLGGRAEPRAAIRRCCTRPGQ